MKFRFGIRFALIFTAIVASFFPFDAFFENWFRSKYSGYHIHDVLGHQVKNGDSFDHVATLFDRTERTTEQWARNHYRFQDYLDRDEYHFFYINGGNVRAFFQFRNGVVVNHENKLYTAKPYSQVQHRKDTAPNFIFRSGAFAVYTLIILLLAGVLWGIATTTYYRKKKQRITNG